MTKPQPEATLSEEFRTKFKEWGVFGTVILVAIIIGFAVKGVILGGMFAGMLSTIAVWALVLKSPRWFKNLLGRHPLIADIVLSLISVTYLSMLTAGITLFVALTMQALMFTILLTSIKPTRAQGTQAA